MLPESTKEHILLLCLSSFFQSESRREGVYFPLSKVQGPCWISFGETMKSIWTTVTWKIQGTPFIQGHIQPNVREDFIFNIFSEGYLCVESWVLWIHPTTVVCFMNYLHYHTIQYLLKIWIPSLEFETIFISKQIVSSFHVFWVLKLSARKIWSFLKCMVFRTWCKNNWICPTEFLLHSSHLNVQFVETMKEWMPRAQVSLQISW